MDRCRIFLPGIYVDLFVYTEKKKEKKKLSHRIHKDEGYLSKSCKQYNDTRYLPMKMH